MCASTAKMPVGPEPGGRRGHPTRNEVYVVNSGTPTAQGSSPIINAENNRVAANIPLHSQPVSIDLDAAGDLAYVANSGSNTISVLDLKARREIAAIGAGEEPVEARITPDGKTVVVPNRARKLRQSRRSRSARRARLSSKAAPAQRTCRFCPTHRRPS